MSVPKLPFTFFDVVKYPVQAVIYLLLAYFGYKEFTRGSECDDLRVALTVANERILKLENSNEKLTTAIFIKNGVIDAIIQKTDSTVRAKLPPEKLK